MSPRSSSRIIFLPLLAAVSAHTFATEWNGQSLLGGDWSDAGNWAFCSALLGCEGPESDDTADFGPLGVRVTTNVDYARAIKGIKYEFGARLYSISGSRLTIGADGISNWSNESQVINTDIKLSADQRWGQRIVYPNTNARLQINGTVDLNGKALALGTTETRTLFDLIDVARTWVTVNGDIAGSGELQADGAILKGTNRFSGNVGINTGGALRLEGSGASMSGLSFPGGLGLPPSQLPSPDVQFFGSGSPNTRTWGVFRVDDGAWARVDRVTAETDYHGKVYIGADSEVYVGVDGSSFEMNTLIQGEGVHNNSRLFKDGNGTVTVDTYSFDADPFYGAGGVRTIVREGTLKLTGEHAGGHDFEIRSGARLTLDVAQGQNRTLTHRVTGDGEVGKTGNGIAVLNSNLAFTGDFDLDAGQVFLARDDVFSGDNTLVLNAGIFNLNGYDVAFSRVVTGPGRIDLDDGELTVGKFNTSAGATVLSENDHSGSGTLVKTGLDALDFYYRWGQFDGAVKVEQGTLNVFITGRQGRARSLFDLEMTGGRLEQHSSFHEFRTAQTQAGSILDLNGTISTFGQDDVDAGVQSRIAGALLGSGQIIKTGLEDLVVEDMMAFNGELAIRQGKVVIGDTDINASNIVIEADGALEIGQRASQVLGSAITGNGTITKNGVTIATIENAAGFSGSVVINQGILSTGGGTAFGDEVDVHVVKGSFGGGTFTDPVENQFDVNAAQGFGKLTGNGVVDFSSAISIGNGNKSGTFAGTLRSVGGATVTKKGNGKIILDDDQDFRGTTFVQEGELQINGKLHADTGTNAGISNVQVINAAGDAKLSGSGHVGRISGNGVLAPGESPGILTAHSIIVSAGIDFQFEFTGLAPNYGNADSNINDLIRLTDFASLSGTLTSENVVSLYLDLGIPLDGVSVDGGFFSPRFLNPGFLGLASYEIFVKDDSGPELYEGKRYSTLDTDFWDLDIDQVFLSRRFEGDFSTTSGYVTRFTFNDITPAPVPLPAGLWLTLSAITVLGINARRRLAR